MDWPLARTMIVEEVVESTSDLARRMVMDGGADLPLVVRALRQTRGRGRGTHAWWSDAGSLTFTIAIDPAAHGLRAEHEARLALAAAVAVVDALRLFLPADASPGIRWPNDIEVDDRKLGGILPERIATSDGVRLLIGIGLNVATRLDDAPADVRRMATSIDTLRVVPLTEEEGIGLFREILGGFELTLSRLAADDPNLAERWDRLDTLAGRWVQVDMGTRIVAGFGQGIDANGGLKLAAVGRTVVVFGGQVLRRPHTDGPHPDPLPPGEGEEIWSPLPPGEG